MIRGFFSLYAAKSLIINRDRTDSLMSNSMVTYRVLGAYSGLDHKTNKLLLGSIIRKHSFLHPKTHHQ